MNNILKIVLLLSSILILQGCGPVYRTNYKYTPPKSYHGTICISNCSSARNSCEQMVELSKFSCESRAEMAYQTCKNRNDKHEFCIKESCHIGNNCEERYRECYQNCGGTVESEQVCTAFCK